MDKIKKLKLKTVFKEFEYLQSECEYRQELISEIDIDFIKNVNEFLSTFPDLKEMYDKKTQQKLDIIFDQIKKKQEQYLNSDKNTDEQTVESIPTSSKIKILYRTIAKLTHPDKIKDKGLNELYLKATQYYEKCDMYNLYRICDQLNILYEMEESEIVELESKIVSLKEKVTFTESTYTWKWYHSETDDLKRSLIFEFIKRQI